jgi:NTE family protein
MALRMIARRRRAPEEKRERPPLDSERFSSLRRIACDPRRRFVVSLGGGGVPALGGNMALVELLEDLGLHDRVAEVWGTSAGAIIGGSWCSGTEPARMKQILRSLHARGMTDIDWPRLVKGILFWPFGSGLPDAVLRGQTAHEAMVSSLSVRTFEECVIPFRCIACSDDPNAYRKVFREGPLAPAISASMSVPGIFLPRDEAGRPRHGFLDGGLVEKTPLYSPIADHLRLGDGRDLLILATYFGVRAKNDAIARGFIDRFLVTIDMLTDHLWKHQEQVARKQPGVAVLLVHARFDPRIVLDFTKIDSTCERARAAFEDQLQNAKIALTLGTSVSSKRP